MKPNATPLSSLSRPGPRRQRNDTKSMAGRIDDEEANRIRRKMIVLSVSIWLLAAGLVVAFFLVDRLQEEVVLCDQLDGDGINSKNGRQQHHDDDTSGPLRLKRASSYGQQWPSSASGNNQADDEEGTVNWKVDWKDLALSAPEGDHIGDRFLSGEDKIMGNYNQGKPNNDWADEKVSVNDGDRMESLPGFNGQQEGNDRVLANTSPTNEDDEDDDDTVLDGRWWGTTTTPGRDEDEEPTTRRRSRQTTRSANRRPDKVKRRKRPTPKQTGGRRRTRRPTRRRRYRRPSRRATPRRGSAPPPTRPSTSKPTTTQPPEDSGSGGGTFGFGPLDSVVDGFAGFFGGRQKQDGDRKRGKSAGYGRAADDDDDDDDDDDEEEDDGAKNYYGNYRAPQDADIWKTSVPPKSTKKPGSRTFDFDDLDDFIGQFGKRTGRGVKGIGRRTGLFGKSPRDDDEYHSDDEFGGDEDDNNRDDDDSSEGDDDQQQDQDQDHGSGLFKPFRPFSQFSPFSSSSNNRDNDKR